MIFIKFSEEKEKRRNNEDMRANVCAYWKNIYLFFSTSKANFFVIHSVLEIFLQ